MACNQLNRCEKRNDVHEKIPINHSSNTIREHFLLLFGCHEGFVNKRFFVRQPHSGGCLVNSDPSCPFLFTTDSVTQNHHKIDKTPFDHLVTTSFYPVLLHLRSKEADCANIPLTTAVNTYQSFHRLRARKGISRQIYFHCNFALPSSVPSEHKFDRQQIIAT